MTKKSKNKYQYYNRELSWLQFNDRVLQEAADPTVPLINRLRFIGIFSNNLDEFFMVRYATVRRIALSHKSGINVLGIDASKLLEEITKIAIKMQAKSLSILEAVQKDLEKEDIFFLNETQIGADHEAFVRQYFMEKVSPALVTIILDEGRELLPLLKDSASYLAVKLHLKSYKIDNSRKVAHTRYAIIEIPESVGRFVVLPAKDGKEYVMMVDDLIRYCADSLFNIFECHSISIHMIKITRDAELDMDNDLNKSFLDKISSGVKERTHSQLVRFVYDKTIDKDTLNFLLKKMTLENTDSIIPGGRYHNRRDYMGFPSMGRRNLLYQAQSPIPIEGLSLSGSVLEKIYHKDYLQYTPYHSFSYVIRFLREVALDPLVNSIKITAYRLADVSLVESSLINAAKNGKSVTILIELQARFDETANIGHARILQEEGIKVFFGIPNLKVHCKICVIERYEPHIRKMKRYGFISTGNFNESTAKIYTDYTLFTSHHKILKEVDKVFGFFEINYKIVKYKHLIVSPHYTKSKLSKLIETEIKNAKQGKPAYIKLRINSLSNYDMIDKLYEASNAGVKIRLIVRGICCLIPGVKGMSENIEVISIVDKYLEHSRLLIFCNDDDPKVFISSADWMSRNIFNRVEVTCPIYEDSIKKELQDTFEIAWRDNKKARIIDKLQENKYQKNSHLPHRSQHEVYNYYLSGKVLLPKDEHI